MSVGVAALTVEIVQGAGAELARGKGFTVYKYKDKIVVECEKSMKRLPNFSYDAMSDKVRSTNAWRRWEYKLTSNTQVKVNEKMMKLKHALSDAVPHVWGYEDANCKRRLTTGSGKIEPLWWMPKKEDTDVCEMLLGMGSLCEPAFVMVAGISGPHEGQALCPIGVTFRVKSKKLDAKKGEIVILYDGSPADNL